MSAPPPLHTHLLTALLALALLALGVVGERLNDDRHRQAVRSEVQNRLVELRERLNSLLLSDLQLVRGLVSVINLEPDLDQARFERVVRPLLEGRTNLRNVAAAPDMVVRLMVPIEGNERAMGLDYRKTPGQSEAAERARATRQVVLAGPLRLVQGGNGVVARMPVFLAGPDGERFWGLVSAVIDSDRLFSSAGLTDASLPIEIAIRGTDATGAGGRVFFGTEDLFQRSPVLAEIGLPQGSWLLAATPRGGWPRHADTLWQVRAAYGGFTLLVLGVFIVLSRALHGASAAREQADAAQRQVVATFEGAPDAMLLVDDGGRIVRANPKAEQLFGWSRVRLEGQAIERLVPRQAHADRPSATNGAYFDRARAGEPLHLLDLCGERADGTQFPLEMSVNSLRIDERQLVAVSIRDVSARKEVEAELERYRSELESKVEQRTAQLAAAKEVAEAASVAKTVFLANMSHEIRTPLNAITGMAYLVRHAGVNDEQAQHLDTLEAASRHLLQVINAILDLSKIESGHFALASGPLNLQTLVEGVAAMLRAPLEAKQVRLKLDLQLPDVVLLGDATRLQQALLNFAANAVRHTDVGEVTLRLRVEGQNEAQTALRFEVEDTGVGIEPQTLARLFNAFEQADNTSTREHGGTGLGLVITRKLAQLMGGDAGASSQPGVGSCFWFTVWLSRHQGEAPSLPPPPPAASPPPPGRVLLVEDDLVNRTIASFLIKDLGHEVELAEDGEQAVKLAQAGAYDLILMDMQMPRMDGLQATRAIRQMPLHARTPIVAITANAFEQDRLACLDAGMNDFVTKPIVPEVLREGLGRWMQPQ